MLYFLTENGMLVVFGLVFVAVVLVLEAGYMFWKSYKGPESHKIEKRLQALSASYDKTAQTQLLKQRMLSQIPLFERILLSFPRAKGIDKLILQAGLNWSVGKLLLSSAIFGMVATSLGIVIFHQPFSICVLIGTASAPLPFFYIQIKRKKRMIAIQRQLPDALDLMTRALRSGHAFSSSMQMVGEEMPEPIANEFRIVHDEVNFGVALQQALTNLCERVPITDLRYFVVAVLIQRDAGGNLTEVLNNLSKLIRERLKLFSKIKVLSSEGRLSAWVLGVMPFCLAGLMNIMNPKFMSPLWTDPIGISIVKYLLSLMAFGIFILTKITKIRV